MSLNVNLSGVGADTIYIEDNGDPNDGIFIVRSLKGSFAPLVLALPADELSFSFGAGQKVVWNLDEDLGATNVILGSLTNASINPTSISVDQITTTGTVTLAASGSVAELGSDVGADITASALAISAGTGIGSSNAIETQVASLEAETTTGNINFSNIGPVSIGGVTAEIGGLQVANSGSVILTNVGSIYLADTDGGQATVQSGASAGNVTLTASGANAGITSTVDMDAIIATGSVTITAGGNISLGSAGANYDNDVVAGGNVTINAGGYLYLDGFADISATNAGSDVIVNANGIYILDNTGSDASIGATGDVVLTAGAGTDVSIQASAGGVSANGMITISADEIAIATDTFITSLATVILRPTTSGLRINLGDGATSGLDLSDAELDRISAQELVIGSSNAGPLTVSSNISNTNPSLTLLSGDNIVVNAVSLGTTGGLTLKAGRDIVFKTGSTVNVGGVLNGFVDTPSNDTEGGMLTLLGALSAASMTFIGLGDADFLTGSANGETLVGNSGSDVLKGLAGNDILQGGAGSDTLEGGADNDTLDGGIGADTASYASAGGAVTVKLAVAGAQNTVGAGFDTLISIENLVGSDFDDNLTGTTGANTIWGGAGNDLIKADAGNDTVYGGLGDDDIYVDSSGDKVIELVGEGNDRILSTVSYALPANVETLTLVGANPINGTGNSAVNTIIGNDAANTLMGMAGADVLRGNGGNDLLDGGVGPDTMQGGAGNDTYIVDQSADIVSEGVGAGTDQVNSSATFALGVNVENLTLTGSSAVNATGNTASNVIIGNSAANNITGSGDNDTLTGGGGADTFIYSALTDSAVGDMDVITDYVDGVDRLNVSAIDANSTIGGNQAFVRVVGDGAFTSAGQVRLTFDGSHTLVEFNTDADSDAEMAILLTGNHTGDTVEDNWLL